jgi:hydroxymethylbilane synthase
VGLLVARADALPSHWTPGDTQVVWSAGLATWRRLAARGVWVSGSDESLGETAARAAHLLFPDVQRWLKLTHADGYDPPIGERVATYRLEQVRAPLPVHDYTHFFWRSGSQFMAYLRAFPGLERAWHGCGPGNTWRQLRELLPMDRVQPFLSAGQFCAELAA